MKILEKYFNLMLLGAVVLLVLGLAFPTYLAGRIVEDPPTMVTVTIPTQRVQVEEASICGNLKEFIEYLDEQEGDNRYAKRD